MLLSLVIPSLNTKGHLEAMLSSLEEYRPTVPYEVIVVDMSSTDGTLEMLASRFPEARVLRDVPNKGYGAACNAGIAQAEGTHIFICNSDLVFRKDTIDAVATALEEVAGGDTLLGFRLEGLNGVMQRSALRFPGRLDLIWMFSVVVRGSWRLAFRLGRYMADYDITERTPVDWVTGAAMAAPRSLWDRLGGFDEEFFLFCEEVDLCRRIHDLGGRVLYVPDITITHVGGGTLDNASDLRIRWIAAGKVRYTRKHHGHSALFAARLGATAAYLTSFPVWTLQWLRRGITAAEFRAEAKKWGEALLGAWRV
jgi:GT2 family glycosyltransferase